MGARLFLSGKADILEMVGTDRIMANSAGDWGRSDPLAVPELILEMKRRGHSEQAIRKVTYENPLAFWRQCSRWQEWPAEVVHEKTRKSTKEKMEAGARK